MNDRDQQLQRLLLLERSGNYDASTSARSHSRGLRPMDSLDATASSMSSLTGRQATSSESMLRGGPIEGRDVHNSLISQDYQRQQEHQQQRSLRGLMQQQQQSLGIQQRSDLRRGGLNHLPHETFSTQDLLLLQQLQGERKSLQSQFDRLEHLSQGIIARLKRGGWTPSASQTGTDSLLAASRNDPDFIRTRLDQASPTIRNTSNTAMAAAPRAETSPTKTSSLLGSPSNSQSTTEISSFRPLEQRISDTSSNGPAPKRRAVSSKTTGKRSTKPHKKRRHFEKSDNHSEPETTITFQQQADSMRRNVATHASPPSRLPPPSVMDASETTTISFPMAEPTDNDSLSTFQVLIRECLEYFVASHPDVTTPVQGRKRSIRLGQVGIRCKYCSHLLLSQRLKGAVNYPSTLLSVYQTAQNIAGVHLLSENGSSSCQCIPEHVQEALAHKRAQREPSRAGKLYWMNACKNAGIYEEDGALWLRKGAQSGVAGVDTK